MKAHYTPAHAVLVVSGPLPDVEVKFEISRRFAGLRGTGGAESTAPVARTPPPFPEDPRDGLPMAMVQGPVRTPRLYLVLTVPGLYSGRFTDAVIASDALDAWVRRKLKGDERVLSIRTGYREMDGVTLLVCALDLRQDLRHPEQAREVAARALDSLPLVTDVVLRGDVYPLPSYMQGQYGQSRTTERLYKLILAQLHQRAKTDPTAAIASLLRDWPHGHPAPPGAAGAGGHAPGILSSSEAVGCLSRGDRDFHLRVTVHLSRRTQIWRA